MRERYIDSFATHRRPSSSWKVEFLRASQRWRKSKCINRPTSRYNPHHLLWKGTNNQWEYYISWLDQFNDDLKKNRLHLTKKKMLFIRAYSLWKNWKHGYALPSHSPYIPDSVSVTISCFETYRKGSAWREFAPTLRWNYRSNKYLLQRSRQILLLGIGQKVKRSV